MKLQIKRNNSAAPGTGPPSIPPGPGNLYRFSHPVQVPDQTQLTYESGSNILILYINAMMFTSFSN